MRAKIGFTLVELLIVVAIIAILAAIAVPNFLEAQTRAKVARVKADFASLAVGLESYCTDYNHYPPSFGVGNDFGTSQLEMCLYRLTTPVAYMTSVKYYDPFGEKLRLVETFYAGQYPRGSRPMYMFFNYEPVLNIPSEYAFAVIGETGLSELSHRAWMLWSPGPDGTDGTPVTFIHIYAAEFAPDANIFIDAVYDPSNGTVSYGDIVRMGGETRHQSLMRAVNK